jgi:hypothetical protein
LRVRHSIRNARSPSSIATTTVTRDGKRGSKASPPMRIRRPSRRGAVMSPVPRSTGATCRGHPRPPPPRGAEVSSSRRPREVGHDKTVSSSSRPAAPLPEWAYGRPAPVRRPTEQALPSRRDLHPVRSIPRGGRRSDRCPSASSMTARTARTPTPCIGVEVRKGPRCPAARVPGHQQRAWREPVPVQSIATDGARRGW